MKVEGQVSQMKLTDKLDLLMRQKGLTRRQFSKASGIPYMTIVSFYEKGTENVKLSTLKKITRFFNVSLDYIANDEIEEIKKSSESRDLGSEDSAIQLYNSLISSGFLSPGEDLTPQQLEALDGISILLSALFDENAKSK